MSVIDEEQSSTREVLGQTQMTAKLFEVAKLNDLASMKCVKCQKTFMNEDALNKHQSQHLKVRPKKEKNRLLAAEKAKRDELKTKES